MYKSDKIHVLEYVVRNGAVTSSAARKELRKLHDINEGTTSSALSELANEGFLSRRKVRALALPDDGKEYHGGDGETFTESRLTNLFLYMPDRQGIKEVIDR